MRTDEALLFVQRYQADILSTVAAMASLIDGEPMLVQAELARARWQLARQLRAYQLFKHGEIFGPLVRLGSPVEARLAEQAAMVCLAHGEAFRGYLRRWSGRDILHDWPEYRASVRTLGTTLRQALAVERIEIAKIVAGTRMLRIRRP